MTELSDCFERRLLTNTGPSTGLARKSLKQAYIFLLDAVDMINMGKSRMGTIALYNAFFHTSSICIREENMANPKPSTIKLITKYSTDVPLSRKLRSRSPAVVKAIPAEATTLGSILSEAFLQQ